MPFYPIYSKSLNTGTIYNTWYELSKNISKYPKSRHIKVGTYEEAEYFILNGKKATFDQLIPLYTKRHVMEKAKGMHIYVDAGVNKHGHFIGYFDSSGHWKAFKVSRNLNNSFLELSAGYIALKMLKKLYISCKLQTDHPIVIWSDASYFCNTYNKWLDTWVQNNWTKSNGEKVKYQGMMIKILDLKNYLDTVIHVSVKHINSHTFKDGLHYLGNSIVDILASGGAPKYKCID